MAGDPGRRDASVYVADRKGERAEAHLGDFAGILQVDGDGGYAALARRRQQVNLAVCRAHVRRKFYELAESSPVAAVDAGCILPKSAERKFPSLR